MVRDQNKQNNTPNKLQHIVHRK